MDQATSPGIEALDALGAPWGNFDGTVGVMPISELEGHLEAPKGSQYGGLLELELDMTVDPLPLLLL